MMVLCNLYTGSMIAVESSSTHTREGLASQPHVFMTGQVLKNFLNFFLVKGNSNAVPPPALF